MGAGNEKEKKIFLPLSKAVQFKRGSGGLSIAKSGMPGNDQCLYLIGGVEVRKRKNWYLKKKKRYVFSRKTALMQGTV